MLWFLRGQNLLGYRHYSDDVVRAFVDEVTIDPEKRDAIAAAGDFMRAPELVKERLCARHL